MDSMKHYSTYQSQFIEMFGTLGNPKGKIESLGTLCNIQRGGSPRPISEYITDQSDGLNWIKIGDTDDSMYITKTEEKIKPSGLRKTRQVYAGDLLLSNSMSFGRPYILKIDGCIHDGWLVLHINDATKLSPIYLCSYLSQQGTYSEMAKLAAGGVVQNLNSNIIKQLAVIVPNMEEQTKYIQILEQADKSKFTSLKSQFIEMFKDSPKSAISDFCKVEKGSTITRNEVIDGDIPVVAGGQEPSCYHNVANRKPGVITVSASGAYSGFVNYWGTPIFASDCNTIIPIDEQSTNVHFLYHGLKTMQNEIYALQKGGAQPHVYGKDIEKVLFPCPTKDEQDKFADIAQQADKSKYIN